MQLICIEKVKPEFQFLIGILKTGGTWCARCLCYMVSIPYRYSKNPYLPGRNANDAMFQFLIGILKTEIYRWLFMETRQVSIPYRYSKNDFHGCERFNLFLSFNSL